MPAVKGKGCGGARPGAGRPRNVDVLVALAAIRNELAALRQERREVFETAPRILRRLTEIERLMRDDRGLVEVPRYTRRRPLGLQ
jgi:hypothetical protein